MDPARHALLVNSPPEDLPRFFIHQGLDPLEMTRAAGNPRMEVAGRLFVVEGMTLEAIPWFLAAVAEVARLRVTGCAGDTAVRR